MKRRIDTVIQPIIKGEGGIQNNRRQEYVEESLCCKDRNRMVAGWDFESNKTQTCKNWTNLSHWINQDYGEIEMGLNLWEGIEGLEFNFPIPSTIRKQDSGMNFEKNGILW